MTNDPEGGDRRGGEGESVECGQDRQIGITRRDFISSTVITGGLLGIEMPTLAESPGAVPDRTSPSTPEWAALRGRIRGEAVTSDDPGFLAERDRLIWNALKPDRAPQVIVRAKDDQDVVEAVDFAREHGMKVAVRGGGHSWCGLSVRNGGMTIDLSELSESRIDAERGTAVIQPSISNRELARRLGAHGLAFPIGHCPTVKASGYLLNGGMSWNMGHWGPACASVLAIEMVTADGRKVMASTTEHPDLFWAARGCGPGMFAVATRFHLKCYPLPKAITQSTYYFSLDDLEETVEEVVALGRKMPDFVELSIFLIKAPSELADICRACNGKVCMVTAVAFGMTREDSESALAPLEQGLVMRKALRKRLMEPSSFEDLSIAAGQSWPEGHRNLCENQCSVANPSEILIALRERFIEAPSEKSVIVFCQSTGSRDLLEPSPDMALSMRATSYGGVWTIWEDARDDAANTTWHNETVAILKPFTAQHYIGETDIVEDPSRVQGSYTEEKWRRLEEIRGKYDPDRTFFGFLGGTRGA
jgi:FAD/FMN-containing dehydrogenase